MFYPLRCTLKDSFLPSLTEQSITEELFQILEKPTRMAGLGIRDPVQSSKHAFETSVKATVMLSNAIVNTGKIDIDIYERSLCAVTAEMKKVKEDNDRSQLEELIDLLTNNTSRKVRRILESKCSTPRPVIFPLRKCYVRSERRFRLNFF